MHGSVLIESVSIDHTATGYTIFALYNLCIAVLTDRMSSCLSRVRSKRSSAPKDFEVYGTSETGTER